MAASRDLSTPRSIVSQEVAKQRHLKPADERNSMKFSGAWGRTEGNVIRMGEKRNRRAGASVEDHCLFHMTTFGG
jgi:hypothetical protein